MTIVAASRLTRKYQATIPTVVRRALPLKQDDTLQFQVEGERVTLRRQRVEDRAYLKGVEAVCRNGTRHTTPRRMQNLHARQSRDPRTHRRALGT